ncbi:MAG: ATP-binding protein [bacterium]|nr:ATP-binding protein [bacterium]
MSDSADIITLLERIATALEGFHPPLNDHPSLAASNAYVWESKNARFLTIDQVNVLDLSLLQGIEQQKSTLLANSLQFANGFAANNTLLWGARGMGKSSLIKSVHKAITDQGLPLKLIEIHREDIDSLPQCLQMIKESDHRVILFCDDLSFEPNDSSYKSLKAVLEGGLEGRPENTLFYATSNRRHLMPRDMIENERSTAINPSEAVEEKISLSDRFGLWVGFHNCSQKTYLQIIEQYVNYYKLDIDKVSLKSQAIEWSATRGSRSGRVAWQFIQDLAGRQKKRLEN